jgi:AcrR family transcriptional regulator
MTKSDGRLGSRISRASFTPRPYDRKSGTGVTRIGVPRADAERNNHHILTTAARVLAEDPGATLQRIADEAGVVRLTIYRRYRSREALRQAIYEAAAVQAKAAIADALARDLGPREALRALIVGHAVRESASYRSRRHRPPGGGPAPQRFLRRPGREIRCLTAQRRQVVRTLPIA